MSTGVVIISIKLVFHAKNTRLHMLARNQVHMNTCVLRDLETAHVSANNVDIDQLAQCADLLYLYCLHLVNQYIETFRKVLLNHVIR